MSQVYEVYQFQQYVGPHKRCLPFFLNVYPDEEPDQGPRALV